MCSSALGGVCPDSVGHLVAASLQSTSPLAASLLRVDLKCGRAQSPGLGILQQLASADNQCGWRIGLARWPPSPRLRVAFAPSRCKKNHEMWYAGGRHTRRECEYIVYDPRPPRCESTRSNAQANGAGSLPAQSRAQQSPYRMTMLWLLPCYIGALLQHGMSFNKRCCRYADSLLMPPSSDQELVGDELQASIRRRSSWRDARIHSCGSTACGLQIDRSDYDFTVCGRQLSSAEEQAGLRAAMAESSAVEARHPVTAALLDERDSAQRHVRILSSAYDGQAASLQARSERLERLKIKAAAPRSALECAFLLWPLASFDELERWSADELQRIKAKMLLQSQNISAAGRKITRCEHQLGQADGVQEVEACRRRVARARKRLQNRHEKLAHTLARHLKQQGYTHVVPIGRARVPLVKCGDPRRPGVGIDITFDQRLAVHRNHLLRQCIRAQPLFRPLAILVKAWAREANVNDAKCGTLCSYGHVLTVMHYLQAGDPPLLPDLHAGARAEMCDGVDVGVRPLVSSELADSSGDLSLLLLGYFQYMSRLACGSWTLAVRARGGSYLLPKTAWRCDRGSERERLLMRRVSIEDPFETHDAEPSRRNDVAGAVSEQGMERLKAEWARAEERLRQAVGLPSTESVENLACPVMLDLFGEDTSTWVDGTPPRACLDREQAFMPLQPLDSRMQLRGAVRRLRHAEPNIGVKEMTAWLRPDHPTLNARLVRDALATLPRPRGPPGKQPQAAKAKAPKSAAEQLRAAKAKAPKSAAKQPQAAKAKAPKSAAKQLQAAKAKAPKSAAKASKIAVKTAASTKAPKAAKGPKAAAAEAPKAAAKSPPSAAQARWRGARRRRGKAGVQDVTT